LTLSTHNLSGTLPGRLALHAKEHGDQIALRNKNLGIWEETSWAQYHQRTAATALMLHELGVAPGDHVAILSDNRPEWLYADLAAQGIGARSVGIYQTNPPVDVAYILNHSKSVLLFCEDQEQVDKVVENEDALPHLKKIIVFDPRGTRHYRDERLVSWTEFLAEGEEKLKEKPLWFEGKLDDLSPDEPAMVVYTSGTTGNPKGALLSSRNVLELSEGMLPTLGISSEDTLLSYLPLCHVAEKIFSLFMPMVSGAVVHFGEAIETVRQDLAEVSPTVFLGVPRIWEKMHATVTLKMQDSSWLKRTLYRIFSAHGIKLSRKRLSGTLSAWDRVKWWIGDILIFRPLQERLGLRNCRLPVSGAAPISRELIEWFHGIGVPILEGYGQTECAGVSHLNPPEANRIGTVGKSLRGTECQIADDGEIIVRGPNVFVGYLHDAEATQNTVTSDGWLHAGDIGEIDEDGYVRITGRKKEIIITAGGKNLSPEKIENVLKLSPYIKEAIAVGDARKFISALIQIDGESVGDWASRLEITYTSYEDLTAKKEVHALIEKAVTAANERLARVENVRAFRILPKELHEDDGELTATQKVRRSAVHAAYSHLTNQIYGDS